jgi:hypothetical protein
MYYEEDLSYQDIIDSAKYKEGDKVRYRGDFGSGKVETVTILGIDEKNEEVVYDLDNGHWCYEYQVLGKV